MESLPDKGGYPAGKVCMTMGMRRSRLLVIVSRLLVMGLLFPALVAQGSFISQPVQTQPLLTGTSCYPEQWTPAEWDTDMALMEAAHIHLVRLREYSWSTLEPAEGKFDFDWLELAIREAESRHIAVLLSTSTSGPPAWLTSRYPEVLRIDATGHRFAHGHRKHFFFASLKYPELCRDITEPMAKRFGRDPNVVGWQQVLDMAGWDDYVGDDHADADHFQPIDNAARHDLTRGYKRANFWVLETPPVFADGRKVNVPLEMGQGREMAWQAIGHGADAVLWWQWRSALNGQETYYGTIVAPDGSPRPFYPELKQIGVEFERAGKALADTSPHADVAVIQSYESRWAMDIQPGDGQFDPVVELVDFYRPLELFAQSVDFVSASADLSRYKLVVAPCMNVISPALAEHLLAYANGGGHLLLGRRCGMKDEFNSLNVEGQPRALVPALGGKVAEFYNLLRPTTVQGSIGTGMRHIRAEAMQPKDPQTEVLLTYGKGLCWLDNQPSALRRKVGKGEITYLGAYFEPELLNKMEVAMQRAVSIEPILADLPAGVEVCRRTSAYRIVLIVINHNTSPVTVSFKKPMRNLLIEGAGNQESIQLKALDVSVLE